MKIKKRAILIAAGICSSTLLHAQELKTQLAEKTESKAIPASAVNSMPSPAPQLKPMQANEAKPSNGAVAPAPSPMAKDKNENKPQPAKPVATAVPLTDVPVEKPLLGPVPTPVVIKEQ